MRGALRKRGYKPSGEIAHAGRVTVVTDLILQSVDGHEQNVFFLDSGHIVATDKASADDFHFAATICSATPNEVVTSYQVNVGATGHISGCPPIGTSQVRWRIYGARVSRLDPLPKSGCG